MCVLCVFLVCQIARLHQAAVPMSLPRELPTCEACVCVNMPMCQPVCHLCACQALTRGRGAQHCFWQSLFVHLLEIIIDLPIGFPINNIISLCALHRNARSWDASRPLLVTYYCGSSTSTLTTSLVIPIPSSSSSNRPTTTPLITSGVCPGGSIV